MRSIIKGSEWDIHLGIEVDDIDSFENLSFIADEYVAFSYSIDESISKYKGSFRIGSLYCNVNIVTPQGSVSELDIFSKFSKNKELSSKAVNFIENIIRWSKDNDAYIWRNDEFQLAQDAVFSLCVANSKYIPLYTDLLLQSDLDHESHQYEQIDEIIKLHGFSPSTIRLLSYRASRLANGQHGWEQLERHKEALLTLFREAPDYQKLFLETAVLSNYRGQAQPYSGSLWFESIRFLSTFIENELARHKWLNKIESEATSIFGKLDMTKY